MCGGKGDVSSLMPTAESLTDTIDNGINVTDLETPALVLDLDAMDRNLSRMAAFFRNKPAKLRPHFKAHQVLSLASRQIAAGAIGITCARLEHAEKLVGAGIRSVLIANEIAGQSMIRRFIELSREAPVILAVDSSQVVADLARMAGSPRSELNVVVDLNLGLNRCGVAPGEAALALAKLVLKQGLTFRGLMGYRGNLRLPDGPDKLQRVQSAMQALVDSKVLLEREGIPVGILSSGGTTDYSIVANFPGVTEVQAGSYLVMDQCKARLVKDFEPALSVVTTVISQDAAGNIVLNAGVKAISGFRGLPSVKRIQGLQVRAMHAEHALIEVLDRSVSIQPGDSVELWVEYVDATISRHRKMYGMRNGNVEEVFEIEP